MTLSPADAMSQADTDDYNIDTAFTPPETVVGDDNHLHLHPHPRGDTNTNTNDPPSYPSPSSSSSSVPWPGSTFILRSTASGNVLTLLDGNLTLSSPGGRSRGSIHWQCIDTKGWLGFRNVASGRFLGHNKDGKLCCVAGRQQGWENFCVRLRPGGGYVLLMTHFERLWFVGVKRERERGGEEVLAKVGGGEGDAIVWEFVEV